MGGPLGICAALEALVALILNYHLNQLASPRRLIGTKRNKLVSALISCQSCSVDVRHPFGDLEAEQYAKDIVQSLNDAGWTATKNHSDNSHVPSKLILAVGDHEKVPPCAHVLDFVLSQSGVQHVGLHDTSVPDGEVWLLVGSRTHTD
jgi:hypothetical protein